MVSLANLEPETGGHYGNNKRCVICYCCNRKTFYQYLILTVNYWLEINTNTTARAAALPVYLSLSLSLSDLSIFRNVCGGWTGQTGARAGNILIGNLVTLQLHLHPSSIKIQRLQCWFLCSARKNISLQYVIWCAGMLLFDVSLVLWRWPQCQ